VFRPPDFLWLWVWKAWLGTWTSCYARAVILRFILGVIRKSLLGGSGRLAPYHDDDTDVNLTQRQPPMNIETSRSRTAQLGQNPPQNRSHSP
jgi:hypothetical protein